MIRFVSAVGIGLVASALCARSGVAAAGPCIHHRPEVRYGNLGYDHIVHLRNNCRARATCAVSTNVNPKPTQASVRAGEDVEVLTMRGSPAREFTAHVDCVLDP
jgi:hypothetical protein